MRIATGLRPRNDVEIWQLALLLTFWQSSSLVGRVSDPALQKHCRNLEKAARKGGFGHIQALKTYLLSLSKAS